MEREPVKVVVVGGGFGGLSAIRSLKGESVSITLIDRTNHHLFQPLLYQVAVSALSRGHIATPLREIFRSQSNVRIIMEEVRAVDCEHHLVHLKDQSIRFDFLILAPGSQPSYFGRLDWHQHALSLKTLSDAIRIRDHILQSFEIAERLVPSDEARRYLTFAIVGGGPTGVELAGAIAEIAKHSIRPDFPGLNDEVISIVLIEANSRILKDFPPALSDYAKQSLERLGVEVQLNCRVTNLFERGVEFSNRFLETDNVIWAAGNEASPLLKTLGRDLDDLGRVQVEKDLSLAGQPSVFVIGDAALNTDEEGNPLPGLAAVAIQQGRYVGHVIRNRIPKKARKHFRYQDRGKMATLGRAKAVAEIKGCRLSGLFAWLVWCAVHVFYLIGFDRVRVIMEWIWYYLTFKPGEHLIQVTSRRE